MAMFLVRMLTESSYMKSLKPSLVSIWKSPIIRAGRAMVLVLVVPQSVLDYRQVNCQTEKGHLRSAVTYPPYTHYKLKYLPKVDFKFLKKIPNFLNFPKYIQRLPPKKTFKPQNLNLEILLTDSSDI